MQISELVNYGFNVEGALSLCIDDEDIYREVLETALEEGREKLVFIQEIFDNEDFSRYIIEAHGLKNAAKQIGADSLSDIAKASELDGKAGNIDAVKERHATLMNTYKETLDIVAKIFE